MRTDAWNANYNNRRHSFVMKILMLACSRGHSQPGIEDENLAEESGAADAAEFACSSGCSVPELLEPADAHRGGERRQKFSIWRKNCRHWPRWQLREGKLLPGLRDALILLAEKQPSVFSVASLILCPTDFSISRTTRTSTGVMMTRR